MVRIHIGMYVSMYDVEGLIGPIYGVSDRDWRPRLVCMDKKCPIYHQYHSIYSTLHT